MNEKVVCPNCGQKELEKVDINPRMEWLTDPNREWWGCLSCGQAFFKKVEKVLDK